MIVHKVVGELKVAVDELVGKGPYTTAEILTGNNCSPSESHNRTRNLRSLYIEIGCCANGIHTQILEESPLLGFMSIAVTHGVEASLAPLSKEGLGGLTPPFP